MRGYRPCTPVISIPVLGFVSRPRSSFLVPCRALSCVGFSTRNYFLVSLTNRLVPGHRLGALLQGVSDHRLPAFTFYFRSLVLSCLLAAVDVKYQQALAQSRAVAAAVSALLAVAVLLSCARAARAPILSLRLSSHISHSRAPY